MPKFRLSMNINDESDFKVVEGTIDEENWEHLARFTEFADQLFRTELIRSNEPKGTLNLHWDEKTGLTVSTENPPVDQLAAFLHRLRPFVLNDEPTNFARICNTLSKCTKGTPFIRLIKALKHKYSGKKFQSLITITSNDVIINSDHALMLWLNSHEYHHDQDKAQVLESLHRILPIEGSIPIFVALLLDKAEAILQLSQIIKVIQGSDGDMVTTGNLVEPSAT